MATTAQLTEQSTSKLARAGPHQIHYNEAGTGHAVIFLHGGGPGASGWSNFNRNIGPISQHHRAILMDALGFGKSEAVVVKGEPRTTVNARSVRDLMDALGIDKATLVGNSVGGATSLAFALDYPDRLEKMVLMGAGGDVTRNFSLFSHFPSEGIKILQSVYADPSVEGLRQLINIMLYDGSQVPDSLLEERYQNLVGNQAHLDARKQSDNIVRNIWNELYETKVLTPTLILHGRNDRVNPVETSLRLLSALENSDLVVLNKCGHWAQFEHAGHFNRLLLDFIAN